MTANPELERLREQLSAWMDGELSVEESRFLLRRLEHDEALRAEYARWQLASASLRRHPLRVAAPSLAGQVRSALQDEPTLRGGQRRWMPWAAAATLAVGMLVAVPVMRGPEVSNDIAVTAESLPASTTPTSAAPSLASADLIAAETGDAVDGTAGPNAAVGVAATSVTAQLPETFDIPAGKPWPKAQIKDEAAMDALLIRHSQMVQGQGVGGFTPFVDVVADTPLEADAATELPADAAESAATDAQSGVER